jgi:predicted metal-dependent HD superfamily phosphohydrolase
LIAPFAAPGPAQHCFADLVTRYAEPGRHYHTIEHISSVLVTLEDLPLHLPPQQAREVRLAAWFHDIVYTTTGPPEPITDEEASALIAQEYLAQLGLPETSCAEVARQIRTTQGHLTSPSDPASLLVDADLAILGAPPALYASYANAIRAEYAWVPPEQYRQGRARVLNSLLARPAIYIHPATRELYESQARVNLTSELNSLTGP